MANGNPYVSGITRVEGGFDPYSTQLFYGLGGRGGFIPGAMRAAERTFFDEQGRARVIPRQIAEFTPDQLQAMQLARQQVGIQQPYIAGAEQAIRGSVSELGTGLDEARRRRMESLDVLAGGIGGLGERLGEAEQLIRGTTGAYDPSMAQRFFDPYEDRVVQQTISDVMERGDQADIAARARDIGRGGESAFGSRARLGAEERQRALGRGLGEALAGIRSRGFTEAQRAGMGEFARQQQAARTAATGLAGLGGTRFGAAQTLAGGLTGLSGLEQQIAQQRAGAQAGLGSGLMQIGQAQQQAGAFGLGQLMNIGGLQQQLAQQQLEAQRQNLMQAQQAPLAQYQALLPFIQAAPRASSQTQTTFGPRPSPLQAGLGVGLSALGALGSFFNQGQQPQNVRYQQPQGYYPPQPQVPQPQVPQPQPAPQAGMGFPIGNPANYDPRIATGVGNPYSGGGGF